MTEVQIGRPKKRKIFRNLYIMYTYGFFTFRFNFNGFVCYLLHRSPTNENDNDNSSESGSEASSSVDSSSDDGSKNESNMESTNWSLSTFVKPDPKPSLPVPAVKSEPNADTSNGTANVDKKSANLFVSPKCLINEQIKQEPIGKLSVFINILIIQKDFISIFSNFGFVLHTQTHTQTFFC